MSEEQLNMTQKELLIRLDERVSQVQTDIKFLKQSAIPTSEHVQLMSSMESHEARIDTLEHFKTRILAYLTTASLAGGFISGIVVDLIKNRFGI